MQLKMFITLLLPARLFLLCATSPLRSPKLSLAEWSDYNYHEPQGPGTYAFGYDIDDPITNNVQFREEERHPNGTVTGSYGYVGPDGNVRVVHYVADHKGYRANEEIVHSLSMLRPTKRFQPRPALQQIGFGNPQIDSAPYYSDLYESQHAPLSQDYFSIWQDQQERQVDPRRFYFRKPYFQK